MPTIWKFQNASLKEVFCKGSHAALVFAIAGVSVLCSSLPIGSLSNSAIAAQPAQLPDPAIRNIFFDDKQNMPPYKVSWEITLTERISKQRLEAIARRLWQPGFEQSFMGYFLAGKSKENGYWATTHWNEDKVRVVIQGLTAEAAKRIATDIGPAVPDGASIKGRWRFENQMGHVVIYKLGKKIILHQRYSDGSGSPEEFVAKKHRKGRAYYDAEGSRDYWVVRRDGKLQAFDGSGAIDWAVGDPIITKR